MTVRLCRDVEVAPGTRASVAVHFCRNDSTLCEIAVFATSATDAMPLFRMFGERFQAAYGRPSDVTASSPPDDFATGCPAADAKLRYTWWWGTLSDMEGRALLALVCENGAPFAAAYLDDRDGAEAQLAIARDSGVLRP